MRWRFLDAVTRFGPWRSAAGRKTISLEEYSLLDPLGRQGEYPQALLLESAVELVRWLVMKSSEFERTCVVEEIIRFATPGRPGPGDVLEVQVSAVRRDGDRLSATCEVTCRGVPAARGEIGFIVWPLADALDPAMASEMWKELYVLV